MKVADLFAGGGGSSLGASLAGAQVVFAANHWPEAVALHALHHPETEHVCQDLRQFDFRRLPDIDVLMASPACQGHSNAGRGARGKWGLAFDHHDATRSTALAVIDALEAKRPAHVVVENVPQFQDWELFSWWLQGIRLLGYDVWHGVLCASGYGLPQQRSRWFLHASRGIPASPLTSPGLEALPVRSILDAHAIGWTKVASKSATLQARVASGRARFGHSFITQHVTGHRGRSLDQPLPTVTGQQQLALVEGELMRPLTIDEQGKAQGFPSGYFASVRSKTDAAQMIGNAVPVPMMRHFIGNLNFA
jgi:DNA (cytosine-5)-methyltransferase 1